MTSTAATAAVALDPRPAPGPRPAPRFPDLLRSEWTKLTSLRSSWWSMAAMVVVCLGFTVLSTAVLTAQWSTDGAATQAQYRSDTIGLILQPGAQFGQLAACVLGVLLMASEFSTGMIRSTVLATPRRSRVLAAKASVLAGMLFVLAELVALPCYLIGSSITSAHAPVSLTDPTTLRALAGYGLYVALTGVVALSVGTLVRHPAGAVSTIVGLQFVLPAALGSIPGSLGAHIAGALPAGADVMLGSGHDATNAYSPAQGLLILAAWTLVLFVAARFSLNKRDV